MNRDAEIFAEAIELQDAERVAFLDAACGGDAALRQRVDLLIAGYEAAGMFLESPPLDPRVAPEEAIGETIGRYTLSRKLGEGGCGVVYLAEQHEPVRRFVALKVIKLGMDTRDVIARFEAERQALALMDHPDIARVFDAGATEAGRPYFVMEFVDGVPITKFCDEHSLTMAARLELFARVCVALQHAHQKGIIHRDLKPSNILVAMQDGTPAPKIIDFGIAKATRGRLTEHTLVTSLEQFIGTPAYMSPEQAEWKEVDIDTRSDVYSLGVLLYELLTGRPPYDPQSLVQAGVDEIRRIIREVEPPRPSTRVSTLADADRATVARLRGAGPMQLSSVLRGDLDWIVMRCLEKERERRYATAHELADDVRRHLRREAVLARPPTTLYRTQKFVARNRLACASAGAISLTLVVAAIVSVRQAVRATRAERVARAERATAERQREQAETMLTFMLGDFYLEAKKPGQLGRLDAIGDKALAYFTALDPGELSDTALAQHARALTQIGETRISQAKYTEAADALAASHARAALLVRRHPENGDMLFERAQVEFWTGFLGRRRGDLASARTWLVRYHDSAAALVALEGNKLRAQRELTSAQHNLAVIEFDLGNLGAAQRGFVAERAAVGELLSANPEDSELRYRLADIASWLGRVAEGDGRYADALEHHREMLSRLEELMAREPKVARWKFRAADSHVFIGFGLVALGRRAEAAAALARAEPIYVELVAQDPKNQQWLHSTNNLRLHQVALLLAAGDTGGAAQLLEPTRTAFEALAAAEPSARTFTGRLLGAWLLEGQLRHATGRGNALAAAERAIALGEPLVRDDRADKAALWSFAQACLLAGRLEQTRGNRDAARRQWERVLAVLGPRLNSNEWRFLDPAVQALALLERPTEARPLLERLRRFGYRPIDPFATSLFDAVP